MITPALSTNAVSSCIQHSQPRSRDTLSERIHFSRSPSIKKSVRPLSISSKIHTLGTSRDLWMSIGRSRSSATPTGSTTSTCKLLEWLKFLWRLGIISNLRTITRILIKSQWMKKNSVALLKTSRSWKWQIKWKSSSVKSRNWSRKSSRRTRTDQCNLNRRETRPITARDSYLQFASDQIYLKMLMETRNWANSWPKSLDSRVQCFKMILKQWTNLQGTIRLEKYFNF